MDGYGTVGSPLSGETMHAELHRRWSRSATIQHHRRCSELVDPSEVPVIGPVRFSAWTETSSQVSHLEALEADSDAGAEIRSRLRELAALKARRERELEAAEPALAMKPDREQAQELVDLVQQVDYQVEPAGAEARRQDESA